MKKDFFHHNHHEMINFITIIIALLVKILDKKHEKRSLL